MGSSQTHLGTEVPSGGGHIIKAVSDDQFASDKDARNTAIQAIEAEGEIAFMRGDNVIRFRKT